MKKIFSIICYFLFTFILINQSVSAVETNKKYKLGIEYNYIKSYLANTNQFGVIVEYYISDNVSLNYEFRMGLINDRAFIHCHAGFAGGMYMLFNNLFYDVHYEHATSDALDYLSILAMIVPEGINIYIPINEKMNIAPTLYPLGFDYLHDRYSLTSTIGMKMEYNFSDIISINPYANVCIFYKDMKFFFNTGLALGIRF